MPRHKKKEEPSSYTIELIEWLDAVTSDGWCTNGDTPSAHGVVPVAKLISVGKVVFEDSTQIVVAGTFCDEGNNQRIAIPKAWIVRREQWSIG